MLSRIKKLSIGGLLALFAVALVMPSLTVGAQDSTGNGLLISPTRTELTANAGEVKDFSITVKNVTQGEVTAKAYLNDFESDGTTGTPKIITDDRRTPYTLNNMLQGLTDLELKPGETKQVNLSLTLPDDVAPGAYFGAVRYAAVPKGQTDDQQQQVSLTASVAHLVFLNVPGNITEQIKLEKLSVSNEKSQTGILFNKPTTSAVTVKNLGNGFSRPFGTVSIYKGNKEIYKYDVNKTDPKGIVLPNSTRVFEDKVENVKTPGKYKAVASVAYGNGGEVVNLTTTFWYLPIWFIALLVVILAAIVFGAFYLYRKVAGGRASSGKKSKR